MKKILRDAPLAVRVACVEGIREVRNQKDQLQTLLDVLCKGDREEVRLAALQAMDGTRLDDEDDAVIRTARHSDGSELDRKAARDTMLARGLE